MERLEEREGIPFNRITSINFTDEVLPNLRHILTLRENKTTLCKIQPQILVLDVICNFYKSFSINPVYKDKNEHDKSLIPKPDDHSFNEKRFLLFESSFADQLKALSDEEITTRADAWSDLVFLTRLNVSPLFQSEAQIGRLQTLDTWNLHFTDPVFSIMKRIRDGNDLTVSYNSKKSYKEAENEAVVRNIKKCLPFRISMLILLLKSTNEVIMQRYEFEELKLFCGIKKGKESELIDNYLQRNFFIIFTKEKADSRIIIQPFITVNVLSQFFKEAKKSKHFNLKVYPFSKDKYRDERVSAIITMCKENTFRRFFAPKIWEDFDVVWNYLVENDMFSKVFEYFQMQPLEPKKGRYPMEEAISSPMVDDCCSMPEIIHGELYFGNMLVEERDKLVFCYKNNDNMYADFSEEAFQSIKSAFFENLKLNTEKNQEEHHSVIFTYDYGLTFVISRMLYNGDIHLIGLSLCSVGEGDQDVYLYRSIEIIAAYTCNKVRETLERTICEVIPQLADLEKDYFFHHEDYVIPYFPLQGLPPACLENWFPRNLSIENNRSSRVLLLDGGGVKGIIEATTLMLIGYSVYLHSRDVKYKKTLIDFITNQRYCCDFTKTLAYPQIHELFDVIVGTSTGSLIATGLARNGDNPIQLMHKFIASANSIFPSHFCQKIKGNYRKVCTKRPQFDETPLVEFLSKEFEKIPRRFPILGIVAQKNSIFSSTGMQSALFDSRQHDDNVLKDAVQASAAAPTYFRKKEIGYDSYVDGGFGSNCPVKEGMHMTRDIAKLEGEEYTKSECTISLGCGYGHVVDTLPAFGLGWLTKSTNVLTDAQKNWEDYPEKGRIGIRLNPGRDFGVGKYDLADSKNTETMTLDYLRTLATQQTSKDRRNNQSTNRHGWYVTHIKIDQLTVSVTSNEKIFFNCESIKLVTLTFNELVEEKKVCVVQNKILIGDELEIQVKYDRRIAFARCVKDCIEVEFEGKFHFDDTMQMEVSLLSNDKQSRTRVACFNVKVASEKAFHGEIENAAACLFAKNIYVCEENGDSLIACEQSSDSTEDSDLFKVALNFACLSGHGCHIENLVQKSATKSQVPKTKMTKKQSNNEFKDDRLNINCGKCKQQRVEKKPVFVEELTMTVDGSSMKLTDVSEPCIVESDVTTKVTLKITANRLPMTAGFKISFHYAGREISGSPINLALSAQHPKVLQRFYRKDFSNSAVVDISRWTLLCVDHNNDQAQVSTIVKADDLVKYAEETEQTLVLLSRCKIFQEYYVRLPEHVINRAKKANVTRYMLAETVKDIELLRLERNAAKPRYVFRYGCFLESLNHIAKYRHETPDQLMEKLRQAQDDYSGHAKLFYGFPVQTGEDDLAYGKAALINLAQVYNVKVVVQTFDHRKQEFYIRHRYHVITPRPADYFKKSEEFEYEGEENKSSNQILDGVVFVEMGDLKKWNNADVLKKYYSDATSQNSVNAELIQFTTLDEIKKVSLEILGEDANTKEYLLHYVEKKATQIVFLTRDGNVNEYFLRKDCHIVRPTTSNENTTKGCVYLDLSNKLNKELGTVLESIGSTIDKVSHNPVEEFYRQLTQLEEHKGLTWGDFQLSLNRYRDWNKDRHTAFFDNKEEEQRYQLDLAALSEIYNVKTVILTYNERLDEYFIRAPWHVLRKWCNNYLVSTIFIRDKSNMISHA